MNECGDSMVIMQIQQIPKQRVDSGFKMKSEEFSQIPPKSTITWFQPIKVGHCLAAGVGPPLKTVDC